jgi:tripartite-type tricarboxylate transporter receptor subunit TctC
MLAIFVTFLLIECRAALAANYAIAIIVLFPNGGDSDIQERLITKGQTVRLRNSVESEYRPVAEGRIGTDIFERAIIVTTSQQSTCLQTQTSSTITRSQIAVQLSSSYDGEMGDT